MHDLDAVVPRTGAGADAREPNDPVDFLNHPVIFSTPGRLTERSAWHEHVPFAMAFVDLVRPRILVELGTLAGDSYCAFCQTVRQLNLETRCYGIDTWEGDLHTGRCDEEVLAELRSWHDPRYGGFSTLVQSTFDDALSHFADGSIDVLHLDGLHQYAAVRHDFETWLPKLSDRGVVLLHDINAPQPDFGVDIFWRELKERYPHVEFLHGHGLGLVATGATPPAAIRRLCDAAPAELARMRDLFFALGNRLTLIVQQRQFARSLGEARARQDARQHELDDRAQAVSRLTAQLADRDREIAVRIADTGRLTDQVKALDQRAARLRDEGLADLEQIGIKLRLERAARESEAQERARLVRDIDGLTATVKAVRATTWWQLICRAHVLRVRIAPPGSRREQFWFALRRLSGDRRPTPGRSPEGAPPAASPAGVEPTPASARVESAAGVTVERGDLRAVAERLLREKLKVFLDQEESRLVFPAAADPVVSILIAAHNRAEYLYQCLESILANTTMPFEVVVVDDASTDAVPTLLTRLANVHTISNPENVGFVPSCNEAAAAARGRYLMFLNNDVIVTPGWLSPLVDSAERDAGCGAVGGKLVRPDGTLQEAGSIAWQDGGAAGYGRDDDPSKPEYSYVREVDFISAAYLLVRADDFRTLGGFDLRFAPAYYEDVDLCMGLRSLGRKVIYQPRGVVLHWEFATYSADRSRRLCQDHWPKFREKWEVALHGQRPAGDVLRARDRRPGKRLLVINDQVPAAYLGAGLARDGDLIESAASLGYCITFIPTDAHVPWQPITSRLQQMGVEVMYDRSVDEVIRARPGLYDVVLIGRPHNAEKYLDAARQAYPDARIVYDAEALFASRDILQAELNGQPLSALEQERLLQCEIDLITKANAIIAVSDTEREVILRAAPLKTVVTWGFTHQWQQPTRTFAERRDLLFVGSFRRGHGPNTDAAIRFTQDVFPRIREQIPGVRFFIVGSEPTHYIHGLAASDVIVTGFVEDVRPYYDACRVCVVPIRYGAGANYKLSEAMSYGVPAVVSPVGAVGLNVTNEREVLIGRDPDDFTAKVVRLYHDQELWQRLQQAERDYIEAHCDAGAMRARLARILETPQNPTSV